MRRFAELLSERRQLFDMCADILEDMPEWLSTQRAVRHMSLVDTAKEIGISNHTVWRMELRVGGCDAHSAIQVMRWLAKQ